MSSRTSPSQFEVMVEYMERNGDLNKPAEGPHGRLNAIGRWEELANVLNLDTTGSGKPIEKWKKVWSDLKNNTKRKAAKINQHARGTGGGPACKLVLTELEQRVLAIMGPQMVTGLLNIAEPGPQMFGAPASPLAPPSVPQGSPTLFKMDIQIENIGNVTSTHHEEVDVQEEVMVSPTRQHSLTPTRAATRTPTRTSRTARVIRHHRSTPRRVQPVGRVETATRQFVASDDRWRETANLMIAESIRLQEAQLQQQQQQQQQAQWQGLVTAQLQQQQQQQAQWQGIFAKCLELFENYLKR